MRSPVVSRRRYEREVASLALRCARAEEKAGHANTDFLDAVELCEQLSADLRSAAPGMRERARRAEQRALRQAVRLERLEHELAMTRDGNVDATTWGCDPAKAEEGA